MKTLFLLLDSGKRDNIPAEWTMLEGILGSIDRSIFTSQMIGGNKIDIFNIGLDVPVDSCPEEYLNDPQVYRLSNLIKNLGKYDLIVAGHTLRAEGIIEAIRTKHPSLLPSYVLRFSNYYGKNAPYSDSKPAQENYDYDMIKDYQRLYDFLSFPAIQTSVSVGQEEFDLAVQLFNEQKPENPVLKIS